MKVYIPKLNSILDLGLVFLCLNILFIRSRILILPSLVETSILVLGLFCLLFSILLKRYRLSTLVIYGIILLIAIISWALTRESIVLVAILMILAIRDEPIDQVIKFIYRINVLLLSLHTIIYLITVISTGSFSVLEQHGRNRLMLGFGHPNTFSIYLFSIILMWVYLNYEYLKYKHIVIIFAVSTFSFILTDTRTSYLLVIFLCFLLFLLKKKPSLSILISKINKIIIPILSVIMVVLGYMWIGGHWVAFVMDRIILSRIRLGAYALHTWGYTFFGQNIQDDRYNFTWSPEFGLNWHTFDNVYTFMLFNLGIVWIIIISIVFYYLANLKITKINVCLIMWALYGVTEVHGLNPAMFFPMLLVCFLFQKNKIEVNR